jgi:tetratricopeptide (TPR) repeat protein
MSHEEKLAATIMFNSGQSKFQMGDFSGALDDFRKVSFSLLDGQKHNNIGLCYYKMGIYDESEKEYLAAIKSDSNLTEAYYNLAVLYNAENKVERARMLLANCLRINRNFHLANAGLKRLQSAGQADWYEWWFDNKKIRKVFGTSLIGFILALIGLFGYLSFNRVENPSLAIPIGFLILILLLPSLRKVKVGLFEMETVIFGALATPLEPVLAPQSRRTR